MPDSYSLFFFLVCALCTFLGTSIFLSNPRSGVNIVFLIIGVCLSLWSFGFSVAINAPSREICLMGRRIAAGGWGCLFSVVAHFSLLLAGRKDILSRRWVYVLMYLPAAVCLYVFAGSDRLAEVQYHLVSTPCGWVNVPVNNGWDLFYYAYYIGCFLFSYYVLWHWGRHAGEETVKKQARLLQIALIASTAVGSIDIFYDTIIPGGRLPQMAPAAFTIPLLVIAYCIRKYRFMRVELPGDSQIILTSRPQNTTYGFLAFAFCAGGFLFYLTHYIMQDGYALKDVLPPSALLFLAGIVIQILSRMRLRPVVMETLYVVAVVVAIPAVTLRFTEYGGMTVWAFPFILLIFSMMFVRRRVLLCTTVSIFMTQGVMWLIKPSVLVQVNGGDHSGRIGLFVIGISVAFFVHKAFVLRLRENEEQIGGQKLIADTSQEMASIDQNNQGETIRNFLGRVGAYFHADTVRIVPCAARGALDEAYSWTSGAGGTSCEAAAREGGGTAPAESAPRLPLAQEGPAVRLPLSIDGEVAAYLQLESGRDAGPWGEDRLQRLRILSNILADALGRVRAQAKAHFLAYYDHLTHLPNRALFRDRIQQALATAQRTGNILCVAFLDLDGFKSINDSMGHQGGDALIREVAVALVRRLRVSDTVARFGGDEFVILLNNLNAPEDIPKVMDGIMSLFSQPLVVAGQEMFVTASAGVAVYPADGTDTEALIRSADIAMYHAKEKGKNQYTLCSSGMREDVHLKTRLTNSLYRVLDRRELELYYQPQVDVLTGKIVGMEALLRWHHPELGMVPPGVFIPLAEQTGLINPIGEWVLFTACSQNKHWQQQGLPRIRMSVNISVNQFRDPKLKDQVRGVLEKTGLAPEDLELEITEGVAIKESGYIVSVLNDLKKLNVRIAIDDFGTEYSSLSRLKLLPVDSIKMDMQFVREIEKSDKDKAISKIIINLGKSLGMRVTAEGVETKGQLDFLSQRMCDEVQGFYYYRPMPAHEAEELLLEQEIA